MHNNEIVPKIDSKKHEIWAKQFKSKQKRTR